MWIGRRGQNYVDSHDTKFTRGIKGTLLVVAAILGALYVISRISR